MAIVYLDRTATGFLVMVVSGSKTKSQAFTDLAEANRFAINKMGKRGTIIDSTSMTPHQQDAIRRRDDKARDQNQTHNAQPPKPKKSAAKRFQRVRSA